MENLVYIAYDGDNIGNQVGRSVLRDDVEGLSHLSATIREGHEMVQQWVEQIGGSFISGGGDEGIFTIPNECIDQLEDLRAQYYDLVGATITIGVGSKMSEAGKALIYGKLNGKDQVVIYEKGLDQHLSEAHEHASSGEGSEVENKYDDAYLGDEAQSDEAQSDEGQEFEEDDSENPPTEEDFEDEDYNEQEDQDIDQTEMGEGSEPELSEEQEPVYEDEESEESDEFLPEGEEEFEEPSDEEYNENSEEFADEFEEELSPEESEGDELSQIGGDSDNTEEDNLPVDDSDDGDMPEGSQDDHFMGDPDQENEEAEELVEDLDGDNLEDMAQESESEPDEDVDELAAAIAETGEDEMFDEGSEEDPAETMGEETTDILEGESDEAAVDALGEEMPNATEEGFIDNIDQDQFGDIQGDDREELKASVMDALQGFRNHKPHMDKLKAENPELFSKAVLMLQNMIAMARMLGMDSDEGEPMALSEKLHKARVDDGKTPAEKQKARGERNIRTLSNDKYVSSKEWQDKRDKLKKEKPKGWNAKAYDKATRWSGHQDSPTHKGVQGTPDSNDAYSHGTKTASWRKEGRKIKPNLPKSENMMKARIDDGKNKHDKIEARESRNTRETVWNENGKKNYKGYPHTPTVGVHEQSSGAEGSSRAGFYARSSKNPDTSKNQRPIDKKLATSYHKETLSQIKDMKRPNLPKSENMMKASRTKDMAGTILGDSLIRTPPKKMMKARVDEGKSPERKALDRSKRHVRFNTSNTSQDVKKPGSKGDYGKLEGGPFLNNNNVKGVHKPNGGPGTSLMRWGNGKQEHKKVMKDLGKMKKPNLPKSENMMKARVDEGKSVEEKKKARVNRNYEEYQGTKYYTNNKPQRNKGVHSEKGAFGNPYGAPNSKVHSTNEHNRISSEAKKIKPNLPKSENMVKSNRVEASLGFSDNMKRRHRDVTSSIQGDKGVHRSPGSFSSRGQGVNEHSKVKGELKAMKRPMLPKSENMMKARIDEGKNKELKAANRAERNFRASDKRGVVNSRGTPYTNADSAYERVEAIKYGMPGRKGERIEGRQKNSEHGVHRQSTKNGESMAGARSRSDFSSGAKDEHKRVLSELKNMKRPSLPKSEKNSGN